MTNKRAPYIFLGILIIILIFIVGFRAGQQVEKTNKTTSVLLSIPPSATLAPSAKPLAFATLETKGCGVTILYPLSLTLSQESTLSARFSEKGSSALSISCMGWNKLQPTSILKAPADTIGGRPLSITGEQNGIVGFQVKHPSKNILITVEVKKALYPYLLQNLTFVK